MFGTMLGMLPLSIIKNGLVLTRISTYWQSIVIGIIILFAVSLDIINIKREEKRTIKVDIVKEEV